MMSGMHVFGWVFPVLLIGLIALVVWPPTRSLWDGSGRAEKIARDQYAAGEIDEIELRERLAALRRS